MPVFRAIKPSARTLPTNSCAACNQLPPFSMLSIAKVICSFCTHTRAVFSSMLRALNFYFATFLLFAFMCATNLFEIFRLICLEILHIDYYLLFNKSASLTACLVSKPFGMCVLSPAACNSCT